MGTAIPSNRTGAAVQRTYDAWWLRDNKLFNLGTDGDFSMEYDADGTGKVLTYGADIRLSDTQQLQFGAGNDAQLYSNGSGGVMGGAWDASGAAITLALPAIRVTSDSILSSDFDTENSGAGSDATAAQVLASDISIPSDSIVLGCKCEVTTAFTDSDGNIDSIGCSIGPYWDSDAWSGGTSDLNVYVAGAVGALSMSGPASFVGSDALCYVNLNYGAGVQSDMNAPNKGQGAMIVRVYYTRVA